MQAHGWEAGTVEIVTLKTSGDRVQDRPLAEIGGKGWAAFVERRF